MKGKHTFMLHTYINVTYMHLCFSKAPDGEPSEKPNCTSNILLLTHSCQSTMDERHHSFYLIDPKIHNPDSCRLLSDDGGQCRGAV
jgi:hypothetical protein